MTIALISGGNAIKSSTSGTSALTTGIDTSAANFIVCGGAYASTPSFTDSKGNTWTPRTEQVQGGLKGRMWECFNPTVGSGHAFGLGGAGSAPAVACQAYSGVSTQFDVESGNTQSGVTNINTGLCTPSTNGEVLSYFMGSAKTGAATVDSGTILDQTNLVPGLAFALVSAEEIQTSLTARNPTFSWTGAVNAVSMIALYKAAAVSTAPRFPHWPIGNPIQGGRLVGVGGLIG